MENTRGRNGTRQTRTVQPRETVRVSLVVRRLPENFALNTPPPPPPAPRSARRVNRLKIHPSVLKRKIGVRRRVRVSIRLMDPRHRRKHVLLFNGGGGGSLRRIDIYFARGKVTSRTAFNNKMTGGIREGDSIIYYYERRGVWRRCSKLFFFFPFNRLRIDVLFKAISVVIRLSPSFVLVAYLIETRLLSPILHPSLTHTQILRTTFECAI